MFRFGLASNGVYICHASYPACGGLLSHPSTLTSIKLAVYFCCTILGVASTGRYPASCPAKPGLSSPVLLQPRTFVLLTWVLYSYRSTFASFFSYTPNISFDVHGIYPLRTETASSHKLPTNRVIGQALTGNSQKILQKF